VAHIGANGLSLETDRWGEHEERADHLDSSQKKCDHLVAYHLAPAITNFISDENRECSNNELEQTLTLLHSEWSKDVEHSRQSSTHYALIVSNPIDKKGSEFMLRSMRLEAPSMPMAAYDSHQKITRVYICHLKYIIMSYYPLNDIISF